MFKPIEVPPSHPRYHSLLFREKIIEGMHSKVVAEAGLIAHGRGESLDYFIGETTREFAVQASRAAVCALLNAQKPVISVNGNAAALVAGPLVELAKATKALLEVNLFYRAPGREEAIEKLLLEAGAAPGSVLGVGADASASIPEIDHGRRRVSPRGILIADVVLVPLEDGDRTEALVKMGKTVITIDLNPLSRTAQKSQITLVDNIVRALPLMVEQASSLKKISRGERERLLDGYRNGPILAQALEFMADRLKALAAEQPR